MMISVFRQMRFKVLYVVRRSAISVPEVSRRDPPSYTIPLELLFQGIHSAGRPTIYLNGYNCKITYASLGQSDVST